MLREFIEVVLEVEFQESNVKGIVKVTEVRVAAEVESVIVTLVVALRVRERSQLSSLHLFVDITQVNVLRR